VLAQSSAEQRRLLRRAAEWVPRLEMLFRRAPAARAWMTRRDEMELQVMSEHVAISLACFARVDRGRVGDR
jgi:hypothetical protein